MKTLACLAVVAVSAFAFTAPPAAQKQGVHDAVGRYQLQAPDSARNYMIDTKTGRVWLSYGGSPWKEVHGPVTAKMVDK